MKTPGQIVHPDFREPENGKLNPWKAFVHLIKSLGNALQRLWQ